VNGGLLGRRHAPHDAVIRLRREGPAIAGNHSVYLNDVYIENAAVACQVKGNPPLNGNAAGWVHIEEYAAGADSLYSKWTDNEVRRDILVVETRRGTAPSAAIRNPSPAPPAGFESRHAWPHKTPSWLDAVNVREAPYLAKGDGKADDTAAVQRAIDEHDAVFLPKGESRISSPLRLRAATRLRGLTANLTSIAPLDKAEAWADPEKRAPLVETVDDPAAGTTLAFVSLSVPSLDPAVYALRWRAGGRSMVRDVRPSGGS